MADNPDLAAAAMIEEMARHGYSVRLEQHGDLWWAVCHHAGQTWYAKRATRLNALSALAESLEMKLGDA